MKYAQTQASTDEFEVIEMFGVHARSGIDLKSVIVMGGVFKETIERVKHLMRQKEKEFSEKRGGWLRKSLRRRWKLTWRDLRNPDHPHRRI